MAVLYSFSSEISLSNYNIFRKDRKDGYGGVLLVLRDNIIAKEYPLDSNCEIVACEVFPCNDTRIIVCSFYRPPTSDVAYLEELCLLLEELVKNNPDTPIWQSGDINLPNIDWNQDVVRGSNYPVSICNIILDFMMNHGFFQMVDIPTRGNNILDIFLTNKPSLVTSCKVLPGISDHNIVHVLSTVSATHKRLRVRKILYWHKADYDHRLHQLFYEQIHLFFSC